MDVSGEMSGAASRREGFVFTSNGFTLYQQNGQRTYGGPPPNWGNRPPPSRDSEVFIGRIPRTCFEDELIPLFLTAGELYEFRLMLDFSGTNRGYAYAHYATLDGAQKAIEKLNRFEIRPGHFIGVLKSKNNCRLLFGNISSVADPKGFTEFIHQATEQVLNVLIFKNFEQLRFTEFSISPEVIEAFLGRVPRSTGGDFAVVEYENHKAAAVARRVLIPKYGHVLAIDWAVPPRDRRAHPDEPNAASPTPSSERPPPPPRDHNPPSRPLSLPLLPRPTVLDKMTFYPIVYDGVVAFFKYELKVAIYKSFQDFGVPFHICKRLERKVVERVATLENCSTAAHHIFCHLCWHAGRSLVRSDVQTIMQEVKVYADCFVFFLDKIFDTRLANVSEADRYYTVDLPLQLAVLYRVILSTNGEHQARLSSGITRSLDWLKEIWRNGDAPSRDFLRSMFCVVMAAEEKRAEGREPPVCPFFFDDLGWPPRGPFDVSSATSSGSVSSAHSTPSASAPPPAPSTPVSAAPPSTSATSTHGPIDGFSSLDEPSTSGSTGRGYRRPPKAPPKLNLSSAEEDIPRGLPRFHSYLLRLDSTPSVSENFSFSPFFYRYIFLGLQELLSLSARAYAWEVNMPPKLYLTVIDGIIREAENLEALAEAVPTVLMCFDDWMKTLPCYDSLQMRTLMVDIRHCSVALIDFLWAKTMGAKPIAIKEGPLRVGLPLCLAMLFQMTKIHNSENPHAFLASLTDSLLWLEDLFQSNDSTTTKFAFDLTTAAVAFDAGSFYSARESGRHFCSNLINSFGRTIIQQTFPFWPTLGDSPPDNGPLHWTFDAVPRGIFAVDPEGIARRFPPYCPLPFAL